MTKGQTMPATVIMGGQWGDEGKGKLTDALASNASMVVRANGAVTPVTPSRLARARSSCISFHPGS
jgi:hypothetical protein